jgi:hypothetical protein
MNEISLFSVCWKFLFFLSTMISAIVLFSSLSLISMSLQQQQQEKQVEEPNPDQFQQTLSLSPSDTEATFARLVRTIVTLKTEFSRATVATRLLLLTQVTDAARTALPIEAAGDVLDFLDSVVAKSMIEHRWSRDQLNARDGVQSALTALSASLASLVDANTLTLTDATRARSFVQTVAQALVRETVADETRFLFEDERVCCASPCTRAPTGPRRSTPPTMSASSAPISCPRSPPTPLCSLSPRSPFAARSTVRRPSTLGAVGLTLFDTKGNVVRADKLKEPVRFVFATERLGAQHHRLRLLVHARLVV